MILTTTTARRSRASRNPVKALESGGGRDDDRRGGDELREGMKVEARYRGRGRYFPGRISRVHPDGTYDRDYDDGEQERGVEKA